MKKISKSSNPRGAESRHFQPRGADGHSTGCDIDLDGVDYDRSNLRAAAEDVASAFHAGIISKDEATSRLEEILRFGEHFGGSWISDQFAEATKVFTSTAKAIEDANRESASRIVRLAKQELETSFLLYTSRFAVEPPRKAPRISAYFRQLDTSFESFLDALATKCPDVGFEIDAFRRDFAEGVNTRDIVARNRKVLENERRSGNLKDSSPEFLQRIGGLMGEDRATTKAMEDVFRHLIEEAAKHSVVAETIDQLQQPRKNKPADTISWEEAVKIMQRKNVPTTERTLRNWLKAGKAKKISLAFTTDDLKSTAAFDAWATAYATQAIGRLRAKAIVSEYAVDKERARSFR